LDKPYPLEQSLQEILGNQGAEITEKTSFDFGTGIKRNIFLNVSFKYFPCHSITVRYEYC